MGIRTGSEVMPARISEMSSASITRGRSDILTCTDTRDAALAVRSPYIWLLWTKYQSGVGHR